MPRTQNQMLVVRPWPALAKSRLYKGILRETHIDRKRKTLDVTVENLDQPGRIHEFQFQLPIYPGNAASIFLTACGKDASKPGQKVSVDVVGTVVGMRFHTKIATGERDVTFERVLQTDYGATQSYDQEGKQHSGHDSHSLPYGKDIP